MRLWIRLWDRYFREIFIRNATLCVLEIDFFPLGQRDPMSLRLGRSIVFGAHTPIAWKRKVDTTETFFRLSKRSRKMSLLLKSMKILFCWVLTSHGKRGPRFIDFNHIDGITSGTVLYLSIYLPLHLDKNSCRITWSTKSMFLTKSFLRASTTYECCRGSWGHCERK